MTEPDYSTDRTKAADKLERLTGDAAAKLEGREERREVRAFRRDVVLALFIALPAIIGAWRMGDQKNDLKDIHTLVNSSMGFQLKVSSVALRKVAMQTGDPDDIAAADLADRMLKEHETKQATVDLRKEGK
jgi:hypothetical protein